MRSLQRLHLRTVADHHRPIVDGRLRQILASVEHSAVRQGALDERLQAVSVKGFLDIVECPVAHGFDG